VSIATHCIPWDEECTLCNPLLAITLDETHHMRCAVTGKVIFRSPEADERARKSLRKRKDERHLHTYRCDDCRGWHVGHGHDDVAARRRAG
jgi:hypothetical protein